MIGNKSVVCVIPARLGSKRLPRKMLLPLQGKPLVQWAYEGAKKCSCFDEVIVAVDSHELFDAVEEFGGNAFLTSSSCENGTQRLIQLQQEKRAEADIWVNWQGDEPFITENVINTLLQSCHEQGEVWTLKRRIEKKEDIFSKNVVKVVTDASDSALYFSRSPIPHNAKKIFKHVGLYAYSSTALAKIAGLPPCDLESEENLEQLRFLYHGIRIRVHETSEEIFGIDTEEELKAAQQLSFLFDSAML